MVQVNRNDVQNCVLRVLYGCEFDTYSAEGYVCPAPTRNLPDVGSGMGRKKPKMKELPQPDPVLSFCEPRVRSTGTETLAIFFDGGCRPKNPGNAYGSYRVERDAAVFVAGSRVEFGHGTNNTAEFNALELALVKTLAKLSDMRLDAKGFRLNILTDSTIVRNRVNRTAAGVKVKLWKKADPIRAQVMQKLADSVYALLKQFGGFTLKWHDRQNNVRRFGH